MIKVKNGYGRCFKLDNGKIYRLCDNGSTYEVQELNENNEIINFWVKEFKTVKAYKEWLLEQEQ